MQRFKHTNDRGDYKKELLEIHEGDKIIAKVYEPSCTYTSSDHIRIWDIVYKVTRVVMAITENHSGELAHEIHVESTDL